MYSLINDTDPDIPLDIVPPTFIIVARVYLGLLIISGTLGNAICLVVYYKSRLLKRFRSTTYLKALACSDLLFLLCMGLVWLKSLGINWHDLPIICPVSIYLSNTSSFLSAWCVTAMTAEMAVSARRARFRSKPSGGIRLIVSRSGGQQRLPAGIRLCIITAIGFILNGWTAAVTESVQIYNSKLNSTDHVTYECRIAVESEELYRAFNILDTIVSFTAPLSATVLFNIYIAYTVFLAAQYRRRPSGSDRLGNDNTKSSVSTTVFTSPTTTQSSRTSRMGRRVSWRLSRKEAAVASLLAARSVAYIILNLPNYIHRLMAAVDGDNETETNPIWQIIVYLLFYTQFGLNFFIYSGRVCLKTVSKRKTTQRR